MGLSAPVPPDIINKILDEISDDPTSLRVCSLAAHSFYEPTRRHLFANITLDHAGTPSSLNQILVLNPKLSEYIQSIEIPVLMKTTISEIIPVLPTLSHIRRLILGRRSHSRLQLFSPLEESAALSVIIQLPHLDNLEIDSFFLFPIGLLHIPHELECLTLKNTCLSPLNPKQTPQSLIKLTSLHLNRVSRWVVVEDIPALDAPNLRRVVVARPESEVWNIIRAGVDSIEIVIWDDYTHGPATDLGMLTHLRHFCIATSEGHVGQSRSHDPIHTILHTHTVAERLEQFTFVIRKPQDDPDSASALWFLVLGGIWSSLSDRSQFPRMKKVAIYLVNDGLNQPALSAEEFHSIVSQRLVPLVEAGLLHTVVCEGLDWDEFI